MGRKGKKGKSSGKIILSDLSTFSKNQHQTDEKEHLHYQCQHDEKNENLSYSNNNSYFCSYNNRKRNSNYNEFRNVDPSDFTNAFMLQAYQFILSPLYFFTYQEGTGKAHNQPLHKQITSSGSKDFNNNNFVISARETIVTSSSPSLSNIFKNKNITSSGLQNLKLAIDKALVSFDTMVRWDTVEVVAVRTTLDYYFCPICLEMPLAPRITKCGHFFCFSCILHSMHTQCPLSSWGQCESNSVNSTAGGNRTNVIPFVSNMNTVNRNAKKKTPRTCPICNNLISVMDLRPCSFEPVKVDPVTISSEQNVYYFYKSNQLKKRCLGQNSNEEKSRKNLNEGNYSSCDGSGKNNDDPSLDDNDKSTTSLTSTPKILPIVTNSTSPPFGNFRLVCRPSRQSSLVVDGERYWRYLTSAGVPSFSTSPSNSPVKINSDTNFIPSNDSQNMTSAEKASLLLQFINSKGTPTSDMLMKMFTHPSDSYSRYTFSTFEFLINLHQKHHSEILESISDFEKKSIRPLQEGEQQEYEALLTALYLQASTIEQYYLLSKCSFLKKNSNENPTLASQTSSQSNLMLDKSSNFTTPVLRFSPFSKSIGNSDNNNTNSPSLDSKFTTKVSPSLKFIKNSPLSTPVFSSSALRSSAINDKNDEPVSTHLFLPPPALSLPRSVEGESADFTSKLTQNGGSPAITIDNENKAVTGDRVTSPASMAPAPFHRDPHPAITAAVWFYISMENPSLYLDKQNVALLLDAYSLESVSRGDGSSDANGSPAPTGLPPWELRNLPLLAINGHRKYPNSSRVKITEHLPVYTSFMTAYADLFPPKSYRPSSAQDAPNNSDKSCIEPPLNIPLSVRKAYKLSLDNKLASIKDKYDNQESKKKLHEIKERKNDSRNANNKENIGVGIGSNFSSKKSNKGGELLLEYIEKIKSAPSEEDIYFNPNRSGTALTPSQAFSLSTDKETKKELNFGLLDVTEEEMQWLIRENALTSQKGTRSDCSSSVKNDNKNTDSSWFTNIAEKHKKHEEEAAEKRIKEETIKKESMRKKNSGLTSVTSKNKVDDDQNLLTIEPCLTYRNNKKRKNKRKKGGWEIATGKKVFLRDIKFESDDDYLYFTDEKNKDRDGKDIADFDNDRTGTSPLPFSSGDNGITITSSRLRKHDSQFNNSSLGSDENNITDSTKFSLHSTNCQADNTNSKLKNKNENYYDDVFFMSNVMYQGHTKRMQAKIAADKKQQFSYNKENNNKYQFKQKTSDNKKSWADLATSAEMKKLNESAIPFAKPMWGGHELKLK